MADRTDTERLDWLEAEAWGIEAQNNGGWEVVPDGDRHQDQYDAPWPGGKTVREAIDKAMEADDG